MNKAVSFLKKTLKTILWVILISMLIFVTIAGIIQIPVVQSKIVHYATTFVSNKTHTKVEIKNVSISFPKSVVLKGLYLEDIQKDTLLYVGEAKVNIALCDLLFNKINISSFTLEDVNLNLYSTKTDSLFNYNFLLTAFSNTTRQTKVKPETKSTWTFSVDNVNLKNIRLRYDDEFGGVDVSASLEKLKLQIDRLDVPKSTYSIDNLLVEKLRANVQINESAKKSTKKAVGILPKFTANKIQINNSAVTYGNSKNKQSVLAVIKRFELKDGVVDLQKELVASDKIYLSESKIQYFTINAGSSSDSTEAVPMTTTKNDWNVSTQHINLNDNLLTYTVLNKSKVKNAFDASHLNYKHVTLVARDFYYSSTKTVVSIKKFSTVDQNNFAISKFETDFSMDSHSITAKKLKVKTTNSAIDADVNIRYASLKSLKDSLPFLMLNVNLKNASFRNSDILYFSPQLIKQSFFKNKTNITTVSGIVKGPVNNLKGENLVLKTGVNTFLETDFSIIGLPNLKSVYFNFPNLTLISGKQDIEMIAGPVIPKSINLPENIAMLIVFKGKLKSFESTIDVNSSYGTANIFTTIDKNENFSSKVNITGFDLGSLLKNDSMFGPVSLTAKVNGHGLDKNTIEAKIKAEVSQVYLNRYTYHNLNVDGLVNGHEFAGKVNLNDENAVFDFDGLVNLNPNQEQYKFHLNVQGADLQKLNLTKDDMQIGFVATADLKGETVYKLNGKAGITNIIIVHQGEKYVLDSLLLASINDPNKNEFNVSSAIIDVKYSGTVSPVSLPATLLQFITDYFPFSDTEPLKTKNEPSNFNFEIQLHNHPILSEVLLPQLKEFEPGIIQGGYDSKKKELKLNATMKKIMYGTTEINNLVVDVNSDVNALNYKISSSNISNAQIKINNFLFDGKLADNKIMASLSSIDDNQNKKLLIRSEIMKDKANYKLTLNPKDFYLMNNRWDIAVDNYIEFRKQGFLIHHLFINNASSRVNISSVHDKFNDDLNIDIRNFKLDDISRIIEKDSSLVKGDVDGNVLLKRIKNSYGIIADAKISNLSVSKVPIGNLSVKAENPTSEKFNINVNLSGAENNITATGYFIPKGGDNSINIKTAIQSLSMKTVEAFSMGQITETSGTVAGNFLIEGKATAPQVTGELVFNNAFIKPAILNNRLELKHETIQLKTDGIYVNSFTMLDANQHAAIIDGVVQMKQFKNFIFAVHVNTQDFLLFNTTARDNKEFYGRMIIDSKIDVNGPMTLLVVNAKLKMKKGSNFTFAVPEDKLTTDKGEDVVEFDDSIKLNPILNREGEKEIQKSGLTGFDLSSIIEIDKQATLRLLIDPSSTDSLVVKGEAALSFTMDQSGKMSLTGAYNLNDGSYLVTLESVLKRRFKIDPGSTITWNGDLLDAEISINANYSVRASPIDLVVDQMSGLSEADKNSYKQRYPFLVVLKLRGAILHPEISFEIQLSPEDKGILGGAVNAKLNMLNDDPSALNKQVFALLVLGRFIQENPLQTESNGGTSTVIRSTVGKFLSSELNKLSSKVVPGVELNFDIQSYDDYETGQAEGRTQVDIGLKKQLFNERLTVQVGGTVDVEGAKTKQNSASDITSDVTIEYNLTKDGRYRLKGFRHNQYEGAIEGQLVETGAGVVYVRDFNKWKEFFKSPKKAIHRKKTNSNDRINH